MKHFSKRQKQLMKYISALMLIFISRINLFAHDGGDFFQNIGKIYVVVTVLVISFLGIVVFLISLERRIKKLEDSIN